MNKSGGSRGQLKIITFKDNLILHIIRLLCNSLAQHVYNSHDLLTKIITDLNGLATVRNVGVDGEMAVNQTHLELELLGNANDHVVDMGSKRAKTGKILGKTVPHDDGNRAPILGNLGIGMNVLETTLKLSILSGNSNTAG